MSNFTHFPRALAAAACGACAAHAVADLTVYTDRNAWVAAMGGSVTVETFNALPLQTFTTLSTQAGLVTVVVDRLAGVALTDPGIINFGGASGHVLHLNVQDPAGTNTGAPRITTLSFGGPVFGFGADFTQVGYTGSGTAIGNMTLTAGADSRIMNPYLNAAGNGFFGVVASAPVSGFSFTFARTGTIVNDVFQLNDLGFGTAPPACYGNCDGSTAAPVLNVGDFTCFLQRFAAGESYANCDQSTAPPVLNVGDFTCFLQRFAAGCP
jgi:hypothetical protein